MYLWCVYMLIYTCTHIAASSLLSEAATAPSASRVGMHERPPYSVDTTPPELANAQMIPADGKNANGANHLIELQHAELASRPDMFLPVDGTDAIKSALARLKMDVAGEVLTAQVILRADAV